MSSRAGPRRARAFVYGLCKFWGVVHYNHYSHASAHFRISRYTYTHARRRSNSPISRPSPPADRSRACVDLGHSCPTLTRPTRASAGPPSLVPVCKYAAKRCRTPRLASPRCVRLTAIVARAGARPRARLAAECARWDCLRTCMKKGEEHGFCVTGWRGLSIEKKRIGRAQGMPNPARRLGTTKRRNVRMEWVRHKGGCAFHELGSRYPYPDTSRSLGCADVAGPTE